MNTAARPPHRTLTAAALASAAALHIAWGRGSSLPYRSRAEMADRVVGSSQSPSPAACYAVATALGATAALAASAPRAALHSDVLWVAALAFATRATFGFAGRTDLLVPGSTSKSFQRQDRRIYSPICLALAGGLIQCARSRCWPDHRAQ